MKSTTKIFIEDNLNNHAHGRKIDLSSETLSVYDYEWLAQILKKSNCVEKLILPNLSGNQVEKIISIIHEITSRNSTLTIVQMNLSVHTLSSLSVSRCKQIASHLNRNKQRIFAIHGGGNIGLGLMADAIANSKLAYRAIATSSNTFVSGLINCTNSFRLQHGESNKNDVTCVNNVTMVPRTSAEVIKLYKQANLAAICVTPDVFNIIAKDIAQGLVERYRTDGAGLKILVLMNLPKCAEFVREKVTTELVSYTGDLIFSQKILASVEFIPTVIDRIVTTIPEQEVREQLKKQLIALSMQNRGSTDLFDPEKPIEQQVNSIMLSNKKILNAVREHQLHFTLFNAEKIFSMYVPNTFPEAELFQSLKKVPDLEQFEAMKSNYINGPHAILAWMGALMGCTTIAEAIKNPIIYSYIKALIEQEIGPILKVEYPNMAQSELDELQTSFVTAHEL